MSMSTRLIGAQMIERLMLFIGSKLIKGTSSLNYYIDAGYLMCRSHRVVYIYKLT